MSRNIPQAEKNGARGSGRHQRAILSTREKKNADEPIQRPYGKSWFSPQAHSNIKALTKEYHKLAKQYHPDVCGHSRSREIFQEILNERAEILESMAR